MVVRIHQGQLAPALRLSPPLRDPDVHDRRHAHAVALGANHGHLVGGVIGRALGLTGVGIVIGGIAAWVLTQALSALFLGVSPHNAAIVLGAAGVFALVALLAAIVPSLRAARVNPVTALSSVA